MSLKGNIIALVLLSFVAGGTLSPASAFWGRDQNVLVTIDGQQFTTDDFTQWWAQWQEPGMSFPEDPREYVDWLLLAREAEQLELFDTPRFREKVATFLKVRALMALQQEEVSQKITPPTREDLWSLYVGEYAPRINLHLVALKDEEDVRKLQQHLAEGVLLREAAEKAGVDNHAQQMVETGLLRPLAIPDAIREVATALPPNTVGGPVIWQGVSYFVQLVEKEEPNEEDFSRLQKGLEGKYAKREAARLTAELLERLERKYDVSVDRDLLEKITLEEVPEGEESKIVVRIQDETITAAGFRDLLNQDAKVRGKSMSGKLPEFRERIVNGVIEQTLLGLESLGRGYETRPPLSHIYQFYRKHRMVRELEAEMIWPRVEVTEEQIEAEYRSHPERYLSSPDGAVELMRVETKDKKLAAVLQDRLKAGEPFLQVMTVLAPGGVRSEKVSLGKLEPEIRQAVEMLASGQASAGIPLGEKIVFLKVNGDVGRDVLPLNMVAETIRQELTRKAFEAQRRQIAQKIREGSSIEVHERAWTKLVRNHDGV